MSTDLPSRIHSELRDLGPEAQHLVLEFLRSLKGNQQGMSGALLKRHAGAIGTSDAKAMVEAVEAGCEQVNLDEW